MLVAKRPTSSSTGPIETHSQIKGTNYRVPSAPDSVLEALRDMETLSPLSFFVKGEVGWVGFIPKAFWEFSKMAWGRGGGAGGSQEDQAGD